MRILIAEDNAFYRCMLTATLTEWGYEVVSVGDGNAAWQQLQARDAPRLAILDWMMPGPDGLELCRRVRALEHEEPTYLILLTARGGKENVIAGLQGGADDYLIKPFDRDELRARLEVGLRIVGLQANLTARVRELEEALSGAQKMEAIGRLAGGVAHDFNNMLTVITGFSELLLARFLPDDPDRESLEMIRGAAGRGAALTRQLLAFSRKQVLRPQRVDLNRLVTNVAKMLGCLIGEDIHLVTHLASDLHPVEADPGQIEQVLMNLMVNARDAMPTGGQVTIATRNQDIGGPGLDRQPSLRPGPYAMLTVGDTGCGMDEQTRSRLFEPFFTTKPPGKGTGLGLATAYGIIKQSGGHITVESAPRQGATFAIYLPRAEGESRASASGSTIVSPGQGAETVLLVEDDDPVRSLACQILLRSNYRVLEAANGHDALEISERFEGPIHLLLTDVVMPEMSGRQLADLLTTARPDMRVLYMSGYADDALVHHRVLELGTHFLKKPFTSGDLTSKVREALDWQAPEMAPDQAVLDCRR